MGGEQSKISEPGVKAAVEEANFDFLPEDLVQGSEKEKNKMLFFRPGFMKKEKPACVQNGLRKSKSCSDGSLSLGDRTSVFRKSSHGSGEAQSLGWIQEQGWMEGGWRDGRKEDIWREEREKVERICDGTDNEEEERLLELWNSGPCWGIEPAREVIPFNLPDKTR